MKKFEGSIQIEVAIDTIAKKLLGTFPAEYPPAELLTEIIMTRADQHDREALVHIWNGMNGIVREIDFCVGQQLIIPCRRKHLGSYLKVREGCFVINADPQKSTQPVNIFVVESIDRYSNQPIIGTLYRCTMSGKIGEATMVVNTNGYERLSMYDLEKAESVNLMSPDADILDIKK